MAATSEPKEGLLAIGHQCSAQYCNLVDFLPFKCQHCEKKFCDEHQLPASHNCDKYDELKHNRVAPSCPLCNTPVTIPIGQDPNIRMEQHISNECSVMTGRTKQSNQPHCANPRCKKLLFAQIRCDKCHQQFCPQHRFPTDHTCRTTETQTPSRPANTTTHSVNTKAQGPANDLSARRNAAMAAIKRSMASANSSVKPNSSSSVLRPPQALKKSTSPSTSPPKATTSPVSKADRSPPLAPADPPSMPTPLRERAPSTCADDVANETKFKKSKHTSFVPPPLFASA